MNGTQYYIGNHHLAQRQERADTTQTIGKFFGVDAEDQRCQRSAERSAAISTSKNAADGILRCRFLPKLHTKEIIQYDKTATKTERDFYKSLSKVASHYQIETMPTQNFPFPYNITLGMWDIAIKVEHKIRDWTGFKLVKDQKKTYFIVEEKCEMSPTLYYIPIIPLYTLLKNPKRKKAAQLLLSICSYLYHIVDIPYYRQDDSYLAWIYEMNKEWVEQDEEEELTQCYLKEFEKSYLIGDLVEKKLYNRINLEVFKKRIEKFQPRSEFDKECKTVAETALNLFTRFPNTNIFRYAADEDLHEDYYEYDSITMDKYISFICDITGWLPDNMIEQLNNDFNECGKMQEPTIQKIFDGRKIPTEDLSFERGIFTLIGDLAYLLHNYKNI